MQPAPCSMSSFAEVMGVACWLQLVGGFLRWLSDLLLRPLSGPLGFLGLFCGQGIAAVASPLKLRSASMCRIRSELEVSNSIVWFCYFQRDPQHHNLFGIQKSLSTSGHLHCFLLVPRIMNTPAVFADAWFGKREREASSSAFYGFQRKTVERE